MGVEFKLRRNDHKKVEDFASRQPEGVISFTIDANEIRHQAAAAEAARANGYDILVEPLTERLVVGGFEPDGLPYCRPGEILDPAALRTSTADRQALVERPWPPRPRSPRSSSRRTSASRTTSHSD